MRNLYKQCGAALVLSASALALCLAPARSAVSYTDTPTQARVTNGRLTFTVSKPGDRGHDPGSISSLSLDGQELLGHGEVYFDTHDVAGYFRLGHHDTQATTYEIHQASDRAGVGYVDLAVHHSPTALQPLDIRQHYLLRDGETGIHLFTEVNHSAAQKGDPFGEMRSVAVGDETLFTFMSTEDNVSAPIPLPAHITGQNTVQDTTWDLGAFPQDPYVLGTGKRYYTKYDFAGLELDHTVHGFWGPSGYGLWLVQVSKDTLTGGPTRYDLMEHQGPTLLNMLVSGHYGSKTPNVSGDWHRTYGPFLLYVNKAATLAAARADAKKYADPSFDRAFYDALALPGYATSAQRGTVTGRLAVALHGVSAAGTVIVLDSPHTDFQRAVDAGSYQYWTRAGADGAFRLGGVRAGQYRLTAYKPGTFGEYDFDNVQVAAGRASALGTLTWTPPAHGVEIWRIGTPDRTAQEFRHGSEYRYYWGGYDFAKDFPQGVHYVVGQSRADTDWNYTQWGAWPPFSKTAPHAADWDVQFDLPATRISSAGAATLTVAIASIMNAHHDAHLTVSVNGDSPAQRFDWTIPADDNSQSAIRSGAAGIYLYHEYAFPAALLHAGTNHITFHLPGTSENLQYDALRLEVPGRGAAR